MMRVQMKPAAKIIAKFGTQAELARAIDRAPTTVNRWALSGYIPGPRQAEVMAAAKKRGVKLTAEDFMEDAA